MSEVAIAVVILTIGIIVCVMWSNGDIEWGDPKSEKRWKQKNGD